MSDLDPNPGTAGGTDDAIWLVSYGDDDDRELGVPQIAEALLRGEITGETIVWREGLADWQAIKAVPSLAKLLPATGETANKPARISIPPPLPKRRSSAPPPAPAGGESKGSTKLGVPSPDAVTTAPGLGKARAETPADEEEPISIDPESLKPPLPAPDVNRAKALSAGTFGVQMKKLPVPPTAKRPSPAEQAERAEEEEKAPVSGTPSLHHLAAAAFTPQRKVDDDIMSLGARPPDLLGPPTIDLGALTAPPVDEPPMSEEAETQPLAKASDRAAAPKEDKADGRSAAPAAAAPREEKKKSATPLVLFGAAAIIAAIVVRGREQSTPPPRPEPQQAAPVLEPPKPSEPAPVVAPPPAETQAALAPSAAPPVTSAAPAAPVTAATAAPAVTTPTPTAASAKPAEAKAAEKPAPETAAAKPAASAAAPKGATAAEKPAEAPAAAAEAPKEVQQVDAPFDTAAASAALGAASANAAGCRKEGDPTGTAVVRVTFSNAGNATRALIEGPPFAGTATGQCIAAALRGAKVPPYGGDRVTVTKRVSIE